MVSNKMEPYGSYVDSLQDNIFNAPITDEEIIEVVKTLESKKSYSGTLVSQHFRFAMPTILPYLRKFLNRLFEKGEFPESWTRAIIVPIHKKGNLNYPNNYRGIALLETFSKIYILIISKRLSFTTECFSLVSESQSGFRPGYTTIDNAFVLYSLASKYLRKKRKYLYVAFVDFQKAFDSVDRTVLFDVLRKKKISGNLFKAILSIYNTVKTSVKSKSLYSESFECSVGLRQGCCLSPTIFILFINELNDIMMENSVRGIHLYPDVMEVLLLMFADDIACISDTISGLQKQLNILSTYCATYKLQVNIDKTKVLIFKKGGQLSRREKWYYNGHILETVNGFSYVGVHFTSNLSMYKMAESASTKAKRVLAYLFNSFNELS